MSSDCGLRGAASFRRSATRCTLARSISIVRHFVGRSSEAPGKSMWMVWSEGTTSDSIGKNGTTSPEAVWTRFSPVTIPQ